MGKRIFGTSVFFTGLFIFFAFGRNDFIFRICQSKTEIHFIVCLDNHSFNRKSLDLSATNFPRLGCDLGTFAILQLRIETLEYLKNEDIDIEKVSSFFPNIATLDEIDLNDDYRNFSTFDGKSEFVVYSNVYNLNKKSFELLTQNYVIRKDFSCNGLHMTIYQIK